MDKLELSNVIARLREELDAATRAADGVSLNLEVQDIELELQVVVTGEINAGAKAKFWILEANAGTKYTDAVTQKIRIKLKASKNGLPLKVADQDKR